MDTSSETQPSGSGKDVKPSPEPAKKKQKSSPGTTATIQMKSSPPAPHMLMYPRPLMASTVSPPTRPIMPWMALPPPLPPPRPKYKYTLRVPPHIWPSTKYPPGIVIGEAIPPSPISPPAVSGTFHSSGILAIGQPEDVGEQMTFTLNKLDQLLAQLNATKCDILSMNVQVVDVHINGEQVQEAHSSYMKKGTKNQPRSVCAWSMVGVSGLYPRGCMVQLQVEVVVRRGRMDNLILDRSSFPPPPPGLAKR